MRRANTWLDLMKRVNICSHGEQCNQCCWEWTGPLDRYGYGKGIIRKITVIVHRAVYQGKRDTLLTREQLALHTCDNRVCCNWWHMYIGDHQRNTDDRMERGRNYTGYRPKGIEQRQSKLNNCQVYLMRRLYSSGGWTLKDLSTTFNIGWGITQRVIARSDWKHVQGELGFY